MLCDRKTKPKFTVKQVAECERCNHVSRKKVWCCLFGVWIKEPERNEIITPSGKIKYPSLPKMAGGLAKESVKYLKAGRPKRSDEDQAKVILICEQCEFYVTQSRIGPRCKKCGCNMKIKSRWATAHCPVGKW